LLMGLGLTPNQAKVYQTILELGNATAVQISKSSSIRREDVYKVLPALDKMGLIEIWLGKPAMIRSTPVAGALTSLILDEKVKSDERITSMKKKFREITRMKWRQPIPVGEELSLYALIQGGRAVMGKLTSLVLSSEKNVLWIDTLREISHVTSLLSEEIKRAINNKVELKMIIEDFNSNQSQRKQVQQSNLESIDIKLHNQPLNRFVIFDSREALISTNRKTASEEPSALWTTDANLIGILRGYFEAGWSESEELKQIKSG
jgi:sugar-specific transcriptional regulator TrmB